MSTIGRPNPTARPTPSPPADHRAPDFSLAYADGVIRGSSETAVREVVAELEAARERRARWPRDGHRAMAELAKLFPSMRSVPGTDPWNVEALVEWCQSSAPTSGSGWTARFLLSVWNPDTDWNEHGVPGPGRFDLMEAWGCWDRHHRAAALEWLENPFWP